MLPSADCTVSDAVCCVSLYDIADHILTGVWTSLLACYEPLPVVGYQLLAYVTMGDGDDGIVDALQVSVGNVLPSPGSQKTGQLTPVAAFDAIFRVRLVESGWPMVHEDNGQIFQPESAQQNALARHSYAHGERMYRKLAAMTAAGDLTPPSVTGCSKGVLSALVPIPPQGGVVGWSTTVTMTLPWGWN